MREAAPAGNPDLDAQIEAKKAEGYVEIPALTAKEIPVGPVGLRCFTDYYVELCKYIEGAQWSLGQSYGILVYMTDKWNGELVNDEGKKTGARIRGAFNDQRAKLTAESDGSMIKPGDVLFPAIPQQGVVYKILKKANKLQERALSSDIMLRRVIFEMALQEADAGGATAAEFEKQKLGEGYTLVPSLDIPAGDWGLFRLNGGTPYPGSPDEAQYGPGPTSRFANELRACMNTRSAADIASGSEWDPDALRSCIPQFAFAYIMAKEMGPGTEGNRGLDVAVPAHVVVAAGGIKVGDVLNLDGEGRGTLTVSKILLNKPKLDSLKAGPYLGNYK